VAAQPTPLAHGSHGKNNVFWHVMHDFSAFLKHIGSCSFFAMFCDTFVKNVYLFWSLICSGFRGIMLVPFSGRGFEEKRWRDFIHSLVVFKTKAISLN